MEGREEQERKAAVFCHMTIAQSLSSSSPTDGNVFQVQFGDVIKLPDPGGGGARL